MKCTNCGSANAADAVFCSSCGTKLELTCPNCSAPYREGDAFCSRCGHRLPGGTEPTDSGLSRYLPPELLEKLQTARRGRAMAGERRMITMLFADVQGSTAAAEKLDPEDWADIVNGAFERLIRPVYRYEGTLARLMGDGVLAFFGAPIAHEDDPERAVRSGLAMLEEVPPYAGEVMDQWGVDFDLRVGIHTGLVVVGEIGSDLRVEYTAVGDAVNLAARMEQSADPGTLLVSAETRHLVGDLFEFEELDPITVKGKSEPVEAYRVLRPRPAAGLPDSTESAALVGRETETGALDEMTQEVRAGRGRIVSIIGEAGIGKSRLVETLRGRLDATECLAPWRGTEDPGPDRMRWASARCLSYNTPIPYSPFVDLFKGIFGIEAGDDDEAARERIAASIRAVAPGDAGRILTYMCVLLGVEPPRGEKGVIADLPAPTLQRRVFGAVIDYVHSCASAAPAMLVFDDLHWADAVSLALLEELLASTDSTMLGVIALMRPYRDGPAWRFHETAQRSFPHRYTALMLAPLDAEQARNLLRERVGSELADTVEAEVLQRAEGNPFFLEEIALAVRESLASEDGIGGRVPVVPGNIAAVLTSRLDRLGGGSKTAVQLASVLGREFRFDELAALVGDPSATEEAISDLLRRDMVVERGRLPEREYAFRHILIQETAYSTILLKERRALHAQVADYLEPRRPEPQEMARHLVESGQEQRAAPYLLEAADRAMRGMNLADAIRLFDQALEAAGGSDPDLTRRAYDGRGSAFMLIPDLTKASSSYQKMLEFGKERAEPSVQISALNRLGTATAFLGGDFETATSYLDQARRLAEESGDEMGLAEYHMNSCLIATTRGDLEAAAAHDFETARIGGEAGSDYVRIGGLLQRAQSLVYGAEFEEGRLALEQARRATEGIDDVTVQAKLAATQVILSMRDGELADAWASGRHAADASVAAGSSTASVACLYAGMAGELVGELEHSLSYYAEATRLGEELGQPFNVAVAAAAMVRIYGGMGMRGGDVEALRRKALESLEAPMGRMLASTVHSDLGWAALEVGDLDAAVEHLEAGVAGSSASKHLMTPSLLLGLALARIGTDDAASAAPLLSRASEFAEAKGMKWVRPLISLAEGSLAAASDALEDAAAAFGEGAEEAARMGAADMRWRLLAAKADALRSSGRGAEADAAREEASAVVEAMEALFADDSLMRTFGESARQRLAQPTEAGTA